MLGDGRVSARFGRLIVPLALLAVAACSTPEMALQAEIESQTVGPASGAKPPVSRPPRGMVQPAVLRAPTAPASPLQGMTFGQVNELLGRPAMVRREQPAEVWQYGAGECVLFIVFYDSEDGRAPRVEHVEARQRGTGQPMGQGDCLPKLLAPNLISVPR